MEIDLYGDVLIAHDLIRSYIRRTPLEYSPQLSEITGNKVYLKLENWQITGSFKVRGALNKILPLSSKRNQTTVVAASTGNHAAAVAHALEKVALKGTIFLPENVAESKIERLKIFNNITLKSVGSDSVIAEREAKEYAKENGFVYVSPYNDLSIIAGQGTIGLEIYEQANELDAVFVPVGGGGMVSGIGGYLKSASAKTSIVGCQPENSAVMSESVKQGRILDIPSLSTISDGTAGGVEEGSITFDYCREMVDHWVLVTEDEIFAALRLLMVHHNMIVEGAAGLALASLIKEKERYSGKSVVLIVCGSKFSKELIRKLVCEQ